MWSTIRRLWFIWVAVIVVIVVSVVIALNHNSIPVISSTHPMASVTTVTPNASDKPCPAPSASPMASSATVAPLTGVTAATPNELAITIKMASGTAGAIYYNIAFKNTSDGTVSLYGFPGVSVLDSNGKEIGAPASKATGDPDDVIDIPKGVTAYALLKVTDVGALTNKIENSSIARIYVPDTTTPVFVPFKVEAPITNVVFMQVSPINAGSNG